MGGRGGERDGVDTEEKGRRKQKEEGGVMDLKMK